MLDTCVRQPHAEGPNEFSVAAYTPEHDNRRRDTPIAVFVTANCEHPPRWTAARD